MYVYFFSFLFAFTSCALCRISLPTICNDYKWRAFKYFAKLYFFSELFRNDNLNEQTIGNMSCTAWNQKRDGCFCPFCGFSTRGGVSSIISGIVDVPTPAILALIARCSLEWMHHPGNVFCFRNGTQLPQGMKGLYLKVWFCFGFLICEM